MTLFNVAVLVGSGGLSLTPFETVMTKQSGIAGSKLLVIICWKDDIATPDMVDGYIEDNPMTFVWYDASESQEVTFVLPPFVNSALDDPVAPANSGFGAGFYAVRSLTSGVESVVQLPDKFSLGKNYPNPFNAVTVIPLELPERSNIKIDLFNIQGQRVGRFYEGIESAGWSKVKVDASRLASGVYFFRVIADGLERGEKFNDVGKMLLVK